MYKLCGGERRKRKNKRRENKRERKSEFFLCEALESGYCIVKKAPRGFNEETFYAY